jgi:hypothetical protein
VNERSAQVRAVSTPRVVALDEVGQRPLSAAAYLRNPSSCASVGYSHGLGGVVPTINGEDPIRREVDVLRRRSTTARLDGSLERHYVRIKGRPTARARVRLRHITGSVATALLPGGGYAPRGSQGLGQRHFPKFDLG